MNQTANLPLFAEAKGSIHAPRLAYSKPTQRVLAMLISKHRSGGATTWEIIMGCRVSAVNSHAAALRATINDIPVDCFHDRKTQEGADAYRYRLKNLEQAVLRAKALVPRERMTPELEQAILGAMVQNGQNQK